MEKKRMIQIVRSVKGTLMAHPDNEDNSEFADRISSLEALEQALSMSGVSHRFSDVDIEHEANERMFIAEDDLTQSEIYREGFVDGAIWIRDALK